MTTTNDEAFEKWFNWYRTQPTLDMSDAQAAWQARVPEGYVVVPKWYVDHLAKGEEIIAAARGLCYGEDWNSGAASRIYRKAMTKAVEEYYAAAEGEK